MIPQTERFQEFVRENLKNLPQRQLGAQIAAIFKYLRKMAIDSYPDPEQARTEVANIREQSLNNLPWLLEQFEAKASEAGSIVHWARDAREANQIIIDLIKSRDITLAVKGKSMISEETGLNHELEASGVQVFEGDLGEFIIQQKGLSPFHIVGPAVNLPVSEISDLFVEIMGIEPTNNPEKLGRAARNYLREKFARAGVGITGVNVAIAETGSILLVENEGNIRMATSQPRIHIALMSIEKVVGTLEEAFKVADILVRNCTGQKIPAYISLLTGPRKPDEKDGPEETHIVILDNGRTRIYHDPELRNALRCIRCGACLGVCTVFTRIGGPAYGWVYSGPMGAVLNPLLLGIDKCQDLFQACTQCGSCTEACPTGIKHPEMYHRYRRMLMQGNSDFVSRKVIPADYRLMKIWSWGMRRPWRYRFGGYMVRRALGFKARGGVIKSFPVMKGWFADRDLIAPSQDTFRNWWKKEGLALSKTNRSTEGGV
ncbi:MAG: lactate utilization protein B [Chitinophagales bacterium]